MSTAKKICAIAGIGPGLGMGIARKFGREGFHIAMISRSAQKQKAYSEELAGLGIESAGFQADLRDYGAVGKAFADIKHTLGPIDTMIYSPQPPLVADLRDWMPVTMSFEELRRCMDICCFAAINCVHQVAPGMIARGQGAIILTTSGSAIDPMNTLGSIGLSMAAARNYSYTLHQTLQSKGVYAGSVCLSLLVQPGDPHGDPNVLAGAFWDLYTRRDRPENNVRSSVDPHEHHVRDMEQRLGRAIPGE